MVPKEEHVITNRADIVLEVKQQRFRTRCLLSEMLPPITATWTWRKNELYLLVGRPWNQNIIYSGKTAYINLKTYIFLCGNLVAKSPTISSNLLCFAILLNVCFPWKTGGENGLLLDRVQLLKLWLWSMTPHTRCHDSITYWICEFERVTPLL